MRRLTPAPIQVLALEHDFGPRTALAGIDLSVAAGEVHGVLGAPGSGKTTLLRVLAGVVPPSRGHARVLGSCPDAPQLRGRVGFVGASDASCYQRISGLENLAFVGRLHGMSHRAALERAREMLALTGLAMAGERAVGEWTPAMRQRLNLARALLTEPDVLLIDEATAELDPGSQAALRGLVADRARHGTAILWATRRLDELDGLARTVTLIADGRVRYAGSVSVLVARALAGTGSWDGAAARRAA
jgi:ABC-2 type transport system ATP-binding protein